MSQGTSSLSWKTVTGVSWSFITLVSIISATKQVQEGKMTIFEEAFQLPHTCVSPK